MGQERSSGQSLRFKRLTDKFRNKRYRDSYVNASVRRFLAQQMRSLRGDMSQEEFGKLIGKPQSVVSRFEDPSYGKFTLQTLLEIAASLDRAVVARIVDFPTFLRLTEDMSEDAMRPAKYDAEVLDRLALGLPFVSTSATVEDRSIKTTPVTGDTSVSIEAHTGDLWQKQLVQASPLQSGASMPRISSGLSPTRLVCA